MPSNISLTRELSNGYSTTIGQSNDDAEPRVMIERQGQRYTVAEASKLAAELAAAVAEVTAVSDIVNAAAKVLKEETKLPAPLVSPAELPV